jgi:RNA polymerase sigma-70 factor (ECF subfamily)
VTGNGNDDRLARVDVRRAAEGSNVAVDRALVTEALNRLQPLHREVIRRAYYHGWTTDQIAADLSVTESVVKSALHNALHTVRHLLAKPTLR